VSVHVKNFRFRVEPRNAPCTNCQPLTPAEQKIRFHNIAFRVVPPENQLAGNWQSATACRRPALLRKMSVSLIRAASLIVAQATAGEGAFPR
jgi:hypothetical protein